jgi:phospholipase C
MNQPNSKEKIKNVFVLMLENRSFDHMLGFSGIKGIDAESGEPTDLRGLSGQESNSYKEKPYPVTQPADYKMPFDPGHEFTDVVTQLGGAGASYPSNGPYPPINNSGFVDDYATTKSPDEGGATSNFGEIMKCYSPSQLPVMNTLAKEFAVCDNWFSAIPGPTWPNRFFTMAASSGGFEHSPSIPEIISWEALGFSEIKKNLFHLVDKGTKAGSVIYRGDKGNLVGSVPIAAALKGIHIWDTKKYSNFATDVQAANYPYPFTFIEPNYGDIINNSYTGGTSQHPMDDVRNGERLIKSTYEAIRNSPHWNSSMLIICYDEHGGFYDHVAPPATVAPGDGTENSKYNKNKFNFKQLGVRVPALVISPYIQKNTIDHRLYHHSSVPKTVESIFSLSHMTDRDAVANDLSKLLTLTEPRTDAPTTLPDPPSEVIAESFTKPASSGDPIAESGNLIGFLGIFLKANLHLSPAEEQAEIKARCAQVKTREQFEAFAAETMEKVDRYQLENPA